MIEYDRPPHVEYYHLLNTKPVHGRYSISGGILYIISDILTDYRNYAELLSYALEHGTAEDSLKSP